MTKRKPSWNDLYLAENPGGVAQEWFSVREAATYLGASIVGIRQWIRQGKLPASMFTGHCLRISRSDLDKFALAGYRPAKWVRVPIGTQTKLKPFPVSSKEPE